MNLRRYMHNLRDVIEESLSEKKFGDLGDVLAVAYQVENIDRELAPPNRGGSRYVELDIAAGQFRAIGHKLKATKTANGGVNRTGDPKRFTVRSGRASRR